MGRELLNPVVVFMVLLRALFFTAGASGDRYVVIRRTWNGSLSDGKLTYRILGGVETA